MPHRHLDCLHYQPVLAIETGRPLYYECLGRPQHGSAKDLIAAIEAQDIIAPWDIAVLRRVLDELIHHPGIHLAVNVSYKTLQAPEWLMALKFAALQHPEAVQRLVVELTETTLPPGMTHLLRTMHQIRAVGAKIAVDDFGAGYSSFALLRSGLIDWLKIDGSYSHNIATTPKNQDFMGAMMALSQSLGLACIAEGVEDQQDAAMLLQLGVRFMQGYYFQRPVAQKIWLEAGADLELYSHL